MPEPYAVAANRCHPHHVRRISSQFKVVPRTRHHDSLVSLECRRDGRHPTVFQTYNGCLLFRDRDAGLPLVSLHHVQGVPSIVHEEVMLLEQLAVEVIFAKLVDLMVGVAMQFNCSECNTPPCLACSSAIALQSANWNGLYMQLAIIATALVCPEVCLSSHVLKLTLREQITLDGFGNRYVSVPTATAIFEQNSRRPSAGRSASSKARSPQVPCGSIF